MIAPCQGALDFVFSKSRVAVFVNGDFWHGWRFPVWRHKLPTFWRNKIGGNRERDQRNSKKLRRLGWRVLRIWEHQVELDAIACVARITQALGPVAIDWQVVRARQRRSPGLEAQEPTSETLTLKKSVNRRAMRGARCFALI